MQLGVTMFVTDQSIGPASLAIAIEERGFDSFYVPEHTHIPVTRRTPSPAGEPLAEEYKRTYDPFVALAAAAAVTTRIRLGTGICLVAQRDPILTAKEVASLDLLCGGRFVFGVGYGWNEDEMADHGVAYSQRREVCREKLLAMQQLWAAEPGAFSGSHVTVSPSWAWPKPVQQPRPPVLLGGGAGPKLFQHIAEYADGWIPIGGAGVRESLPALHRALAEAGRDPRSARVALFGSIPTPAKLDYFAAVGVAEVVCNLRSTAAPEALAQLDRYATLVPQAHALASAP
jgi:probable F420-dependent oxidoreductase